MTAITTPGDFQDLACSGLQPANGCRKHEPTKANMASIRCGKTLAVFRKFQRCRTSQGEFSAGHTPHYGSALRYSGQDQFSIWVELQADDGLRVAFERFQLRFA